MTEFGRCDHCKKYGIITPHMVGDICKYKICVFCEAEGNFMGTIRRERFEKEKKEILEQTNEILDGIEKYLFATPESEAEEKRYDIDEDIDALKSNLECAFLCPRFVDEPQKGDDI